mgnify:CR=1 FL=1
MTSTRALARLLATPVAQIESKTGYRSVSNLVNSHMVKDFGEVSAAFPRSESLDVETKKGEELHRAIDVQIKNEIAHWNHEQQELDSLNRRLSQVERSSREAARIAFRDTPGLTLWGTEHVYQDTRARLEAQARQAYRPFTPNIPAEVLPTMSTIEYGQYQNFRRWFAQMYPSFYPVASEMTVHSPKTRLIGRIDALFTDDNGRAIIIDWKRSRTPGGNSVPGSQTATGPFKKFPNTVDGRRSAQLNVYREILEEAQVNVFEIMTVVFHHNLGIGNYAWTRSDFKKVYSA